MKNTITVTIPFSFKGKDYQPSSVIDLDDYIQKHNDFSSVFHQIAAENNIDPYSYEYEVLESSPVFFSQATGLASECYSDGQFDLQCFIQKKQQNNTQKAQDVIQKIASEILHIEQLEENQAMSKALLKAYQMGQQSILEQHDN